jgi:hypothetical protein
MTQERWLPLAFGLATRPPADPVAPAVARSRGSE